jgi:uncharacterized repeat protein (TIGR01451 family)
MLKRKVFGVCLLVTILAVVLTAYCPVAAQAPDKLGLTLNLSPWNYSSGLTPGQANTFYLEVRNNGNTGLTNIRFGSSAPKDWQVQYTPSSLEALSAGSTDTVKVDIIPPANVSGRGDYNVTFIAEANEVRAVTTAFLRVEGGSPFWIWIGIGVAVIAIAIFAVIYVRFGRN